MINLLPSEQKDEITYAKKNTTLLHWAVWLLLAISVGVGIVLAGTIYINQSTASYTKRVAESQQALETKELGDAQKRITDLSNNVALIEKVLNRNILFSKLLKQAGSVMPDGTILLNLELSQVKGGIDLSAGAKDYNSATQIQVNLEDPNNKLFDKVDIVSINCSEGSENQYPCTASLRALFSDENPYLFTTETQNDGEQP